MRALILATGLMLFGTAALAQPVVQERLKAIQADPASVKIAVDAGRKASFFCANCHGENGISKTPDVPNLAGQNPAYILEQMRKFVSGERKDPFMQGLIKVLKEDERMQVALFYASATVRHPLPMPPRLCVARNSSANSVYAAMASKRVAMRKFPGLPARSSRICRAPSCAIVMEQVSAAISPCQLPQHRSRTKMSLRLPIT